MLATALALMLTATATGPTGPIKLVTTPWHTANLDPSLAAFYLEAFAKALRGHGLSVVTSSDIAAVLGVERQKELLTCNEGSSCLAELGNALGCDGIVVVSAAKLDGTLSATVRVVSAGDGRVLAETSVESGSERGFIDALDGAAGRLAAVLRGPAQAAGPSRAAPLALGIGGGALAIGGGVSLLLAFNTAAALDAQLAGSQAVTPTAVQLAATGKLEQTLGWVGVGAGAVLVVTAVLVWVFDTPATLALVPTASGATLSFGGRWP